MVAIVVIGALIAGVLHVDGSRIGETRWSISVRLAARATQPIRAGPSSSTSMVTA
jgi:hypothetical protein